MLSYRDGQQVVVCDGCHGIIDEESPGNLAYLAHRSDGRPISGHVHGDECGEKFKAAALKLRVAKKGEVKGA